MSDKEAWSVDVRWSLKDEVYLAQRLALVPAGSRPLLTTHGDSPTEALAELVTALELEENVAAKAATTCWFCSQPRNAHEAGCTGERLERQAKASEEALREEGRQAERAAVLAWLWESSQRYAARAGELAGKSDAAYDDLRYGACGAETALCAAGAAIEAGEHLATKEAP